ncbi:MAG: hypothetical protein CM1200mP15_04800 [Dehalococcoidia bacterium]|nr:MAG: hypothetical protein CM1200mP15_04800 [Dehalococcoidia bacterium]
MRPRGITYLDHAGTTPTSPEVVEAMLPLILGICMVTLLVFIL